MTERRFRASRRTPVSAPAPDPAADAAVARLWLTMLHELAGRGAHEVKNALNGVAVNVEVVRSRLQRAAAGGASPPPGGVVAFANSASAQLEELTTLVETLLALARPVREPVNVAVVLRYLVVAVEATGASVELDVDADADEMTTPVAGDAARYILAAALLTRAPQPAATRCRVKARGGTVEVRVRREGPRESLPPAAAALAAAVGVELSADEDGVRIIFPECRPIRRDGRHPNESRG